MGDDGLATIFQSHFSCSLQRQFGWTNGKVPKHLQKNKSRKTPTVTHRHIQSRRISVSSDTPPVSDAGGHDTLRKASDSVDMDFKSEDEGLESNRQMQEAGSLPASRVQEFALFEGDKPGPDECEVRILQSLEAALKGNGSNLKAAISRLSGRRASLWMKDLSNALENMSPSHERIKHSVSELVLTECALSKDHWRVLTAWMRGWKKTKLVQLMHVDLVDNDGMDFFVAEAFCTTNAVILQHSNATDAFLGTVLYRTALLQPSLQLFQLQRLDLSHNHLTKSDSVTSLLSTAPLLTYLDLSWNRFNGDALTRAFDDDHLRQHCQLIFLNVSNNPCSCASTKKADALFQSLSRLLQANLIIEELWVVDCGLAHHHIVRWEELFEQANIGTTCGVAVDSAQYVTSLSPRGPHAEVMVGDKLAISSADCLNAVFRGGEIGTWVAVGVRCDRHGGWGTICLQRMSRVLWRLPIPSEFVTHFNGEIRVNSVSTDLPIRLTVPGQAGFSEVFRVSDGGGNNAWDERGFEGWDTESFDGSDDGDERDSESKQSFIVTSARDLDDEMRLPLPPPYDICVPPGSVICSKPSKELTSDTDLRQSEGVVLWRRKLDHSPEVLGESSPMVELLSKVYSFPPGELAFEAPLHPGAKAKAFSRIWRRRRRVVRWFARNDMDMERAKCDQKACTKSSKSTYQYALEAFAALQC